jgi:hypothetical protein
LYIAFAGEKRMPTQNLRVGFSATASVGERGNDISLKRRLCRFLAADVMLFPPVQVRLGSNPDLEPRLSQVRSSP